MHENDEDLLRLADGELPVRDAAKLRDHLSSCGECQSRYAAIGGALEEYRTHHRDGIKGRDPAPPRAWPDLRGRLDQIDATARKRTTIHRAWFAAAAAALIAIVSVYEMRSPAITAGQLLEKAVAAAAPNPGRHIRIRARGASLVRPAVWRRGDAPSQEREMAALFASARYDWEDPLSARSFVRWRAQLKQKTDRIQVIPAGRSHPGIYEIHTVTTSSVLSEAMLALRVDDLLPVQETMRIGGDLVEIDAIDSPPDAAPSPRGPSRPDRVQSGPEESAGAPRTARPATLAEELRVVAALHRIAADLGEPVDVSRENGTLAVRGTGLTTERAQQVREAVSVVPGAAVTFDQPGSEKLDDGGRNKIQVSAGVRTELESRLDNDSIDRILDASDALRARAFALRSLAKRFSPDLESQLSPADRAVLWGIEKDHAVALAGGLRDLESALAPVLPQSLAVTITLPPNWQAGCIRISATAQQLDQLLNRMFASGGYFSTGLQELAGDLRQLEAEVRAYSEVRK
jgi:hypothetical protein